MTTLSLYGYRVDAVIANRIFPGGDPWRDAWAEAQQAQLQAVRGVVRSAAAAAHGLSARRARRGRRPGALLGRAGLRRGRSARLARRRPTRSASGARATVSQLALLLPFATREEVGLTRRGDELAVTLGSWRRLLSLPSALRRCLVTGARLSDGRLDVDVRARPGALDADVTATTGPHAHGPLAEEAAKLAEALSGWVSAGFTQPLMEGRASPRSAGSARCASCCGWPRAARPEVFEHLGGRLGLADGGAACGGRVVAGLVGVRRRPPSERIDIR